MTDPRIIWPNFIEYEATGKPHEIANGVYEWLRKNTKLAPFRRFSEEKILQAIARGWCHERTKHKIMDPTLATEICKEIVLYLKEEFGEE